MTRSSPSFARLYHSLFQDLMHQKDLTIECRGMKIWKELTGLQARYRIGASSDTMKPLISVYSHQWNRVTPIKFALAELCYYLAGSDGLENIASYNKAMLNYSNDGKTIDGSYGIRLRDQLPKLIERLKGDKFTRQACAAIFTADDCLLPNRPHIPCNTMLQYIFRPTHLELHVTSRSSDFATGFSIDGLHWQALVAMMGNELRTHYHEPIIHSEVVYNLGSLHVYKADEPVMKLWRADFDFPSYEYTIAFPLPLSEAIERCRTMFKPGLSLYDLCVILGIDRDSISMELVLHLHKLFTEHRNKFVR